MDDALKELIVIGASVTAHCQPCVTITWSGRRRAIDMRKLNILFCAPAPCRSQMAEARARALKGDVLEAYWAASRRTG